MPDSNLQGPALAALIAALMCIAAACAVTETAEPATPATPQPTATATRTHDLPESRFAAKRFLAQLTGDEPLMPTRIPGDLSREEMEQVARQLAEDIGDFGDAHLAALEPRHGSKTDDIVFFRWEDLATAQGPHTPMLPYLQPGITTNGELIRFANYIR